MEGNPELPAASKVLLLCLQAATFPDSLDALQMYPCARRNYAVGLLKQSSCLSLVCGHFSVDLSPAVDCALFGMSPSHFLRHPRVYHPAHHLTFQSAVLTDHGKSDF